jgi:U3 small nucleolar RNA-associated protein 21
LLKKATSLSIPLASLKFPPIVSISYSPSRAKDWDDIVTAHTDEAFVRTWTMLGKKVGKHNLGLADIHKSKKKAKGLGNIGSIKVSLSFIRGTILISKLNDRRYV